MRSCELATSLIICTRNRPTLLLQTIEAVLRGHYLPDEIVVADQSDTPLPDLAGMATDGRCQIRHLTLRSVGLDRARNAAVRAARGEILVLIDDDVLVEPEWFGALVGALKLLGQQSAVTGRVLPGEASIPGGFAPSVKVDEKPAAYSGRIGEDVLFTNNAALFRSAIERVGLFDERLDVGSRFPSSGDNDFGYRLLEAGYTIHYVPEAVVYHVAWRAARDFVPLQWRYGRGQGAFYAKHLDLRDRYVLRRLIGHLLVPVSRFIRRSRQRNLRGLFGDVAFALGVLLGATEWILTQRATPAVEGDG